MTTLTQHVQITTPDLRAMGQSTHLDPDISATLSDFLTYTEHLPSSVIRSLTLIANQDRIATEEQERIHQLLVTYSQLPTLEAPPNAIALRKNISHAYQRMESARRMAAVESLRMTEQVSKDRARLEIVRTKLRKMPMPPSRDATPEPMASPNMRKAQPTTEKRAAHRTGTAPRVRGRKVMVPGEVLPPPGPDSPPPSEPSSPLPSPVRQKSIPKREKIPKPPRARSAGLPGTNVHSAVAGISTSNALLALVPPPPDSRPGSKWLPWKRITEYELAKLRKRMKKNAIWLPSSAMRNRELKMLGRGQQAMDQAKTHAQASGEPFLDEYDSAWSDPTKAMISGEEKAEMAAMLGPELEHGNEDEALMNRGMRLNEAKKRKREKQLEEQAQEEKKQKRETPEDDAGPVKRLRLSIPPNLPPKARHASMAPEGKTRPAKIVLAPSKAASAEPERSTTVERKSTRRPAPGVITAEDGSTKVSVGRRKNAPKKKDDPVLTEEYIDPSEPRYCICGDVSWGTMIACDGDTCEQEWFHLDCVGLKEMPPRRTKWYCPDCRRKLKLETTNGVVR